MNPERVQGLLAARIGLDAASLGKNVVSTAIRDHAYSLGFTDVADYLARLERDPIAFQELVNRLVVPETWYFRGAGLFELLARRVAELVRTAPPDRVIRVLSVPCSTGEEPYSVAMAVNELGVPAERVNILGVDISPVALAQAERGISREFSFRQASSKWRERYFRPVEGGWELFPDIRRRVRFQAGNVLEPGFLMDASGMFDLILCRNLLIYFTPEARRRAVDTLDRLLSPSGWLVVGHAEPAALAGRAFRPVGEESLFVFERGPATIRTKVEPIRTPSVSNVPVVPPIAPAPVPVSVKPVVSVPPAAPVSVETRVRTLADTGKLAEALAECQAWITASPSADGYALLGVILQARGETGPANEAFRRALYLNPQHREALAHAMLLARNSGSIAQAELFRARLQQLPDGGEQ